MQKNTEIKSLTGIRGVAACYVMAYHFVPEALPGAAGEFFRHGYLSVDLFFVLSGFVMALTYAQDFSAGFSFDRYRQFLVKRLGRVYPLYIVTTVAAAAIVISRHEGHISALRWACNLLLIQSWGVSGSIAHSVWSISTELAAYVLFPALLAFSLFSRPRVAIVAAIFGVACMIVLAATTPHELHQVVKNGQFDIYGEQNAFPLLRCLAGFFFGLLAFRSWPKLRNALGGHITDVISIAILALLALPGTDLAIIALLPALVVGLTENGSVTVKALSRPIIYWLGEVSYSIYLVHRLIESIAEQPLRKIFSSELAVGLVMAAATIGLAAITFYGIEKPCRGISRRVFTSRKPRAAHG